jgi:hypothetical protein
MFKKNIGTIDRALRLILGVVMLGSYFMYPEMGFRSLLLIGIIPLVTALMSSCPIYSLFGLSTCPRKRS